MNLNTTKLELALARTGLSQKELCNQSGIPVITLSQIMRGVREPRPKTLGRIAKALNVDPAELIETEVR